MSNSRELLQQSWTDLQTQVQKHEQLMRAVLEDSPLKDTCLWSDCRHQQLLLNLVVEAVQVLDDTRKAFKSKQLEQLRKRLLQVLTEETRCDSMPRLSEETEVIRGGSRIAFRPREVSV
jgi:hypothetical protein